MNRAGGRRSTLVGLLVALTALVGACSSEPDGETHRYVIDAGTAARIADGDDVEILPAEMTMHVGDTIEIVNNDDADHLVGVFFIAKGETLSQRFTSAGVLEGECTVHQSGQIRLVIEE